MNCCKKNSNYKIIMWTAITLCIIAMVVFGILLLICIASIYNPTMPYIIGGYQCNSEEDTAYKNYKTRLVEFKPHFQIENAVFLATLCQNIANIPCNSCKFPKLDLHEKFDDIELRQKFPFMTKIRYCRVSYSEDRKVALIYCQAYKSIPMLNFLLDTYQISKFNGYIYRGLYKMFQQFEHELKSILEECPSKQFVFFGHSIGGVLAYFAALNMLENLEKLNSNNVFVYTIGSMRPGDKNFSDYYNSKIPNTFRIANVQDIIPASPMSSENYVYRHVGKYVPVDFNGRRYHGHNIVDYVESLIEIV